MVLSKMEQKDMYLSTSHVSFESEVVAEYQRDRDGDRQTEREREIERALNHGHLRESMGNLTTVMGCSQWHR